MHNCFASLFFLTVIIVAGPHLFPLSYYFLSWILFISHYGKVFSFMLLDDSSSCRNSYILILPKHISIDIPCTLRHCKCSYIFTPTMAASMAFTARISTFNNCEINSPTLVFFVRSAATFLHGKYFTCKNYISTLFPALTNTSFKTSIKSSSENCWLVTFREERILLLGIWH